MEVDKMTYKKPQEDQQSQPIEVEIPQGNEAEVEVKPATEDKK
jgi:hypothetical protein